MTETICPEVVICVLCAGRTAFENLAIANGAPLYFGPSGVVKDSGGNIMPAETEGGCCVTCYAKLVAERGDARRIAGEIPPETEIA